ncbi:unnamed protein product [Lactuca virosa]|uniref:CCHC-type domain-containing protein n=1 Tax=Lactuca virosa TaxID=75947 RepID=A0AAU9MRD4_9ASTR|nr:unnamed protein product [Lactuca virosa]
MASSSSSDSLLSISSRTPHCQLCRTNGHYVNACPQLARFASTVHGPPIPNPEADLTRAFHAQCHVTSYGPDWYVDSGTSDHMSSSAASVPNPAPFTGPQKVFFGNGQKDEADTVIHDDHDHVSEPDESEPAEPAPKPASPVLPTSSPQWPPPPSHPMITRSKAGIFKPRYRVDLASSSSHGLTAALRSLNRARDIYNQIKENIEQMGLKISSCGDDMVPLCRCLVDSYFRNAALQQPEGTYK